MLKTIWSSNLNDNHFAKFKVHSSEIKKVYESLETYLIKTLKGITFELKLWNLNKKTTFVW